MFLKEVYRHSKWMFACMLFFMVVQLGVNYKKGMVFSPFFHYGMYSGKPLPDSVFRVTLVKMDGDTLRGQDFTPPQWDKVQYTLQQILASSCDSHFYHTQVERLHEKAGFWKPDPTCFINKGNLTDRLAVYKKWLAGQTGNPGAKVEVIQGSYVFKNGRFVFVRQFDTLLATNYLCN